MLVIFMLYMRLLSHMTPVMSWRAVLKCILLLISFSVERADTAAGLAPVKRQSGAIEKLNYHCDRFY